jgi:hypothetical protein
MLESHSEVERVMLTQMMDVNNTIFKGVVMNNITIDFSISELKGKKQSSAWIDISEFHLHIKDKQQCWSHFIAALYPCSLNET